MKDFKNDAVIPFSSYGNKKWWSLNLSKNGLTIVPCSNQCSSNGGTGQCGTGKRKK